ncbi:MAG TPA: alcohol dehydrogenase [Cytophagales bacterium]|nr:alcohol dehydrogenase [Cytophagales bacterium]HAP61349.1 alcohol dehydrogenase [Cytophagales bacterium]
MKAAVFESFQGNIQIQKVPDPTPQPHGVVIQVEATGLCRSDWHGWMGHDPDIVLPHVPGHELAGSIAAVGRGVKNFAVGDRVTVPFVCGCGHCHQCVSGNHQVCDHQTQPGFTHWGSFAEYVTIHQADINLVHLPGHIDYVTAALLGCRFVTAFRAVKEQGKVSGGQYVAVHGCGGVGLSAVMIARALGALPIAIDIDPDTLALARQLGAIATINARDTPQVPEAIRELTQGGAHISLDALGSAQTCFNSVACLRKRGKHIQVGLMTEGHAHAPVPMDRVLADELEILGSHGMQAHRYPEMLDMMEKGLLQPEKLIEKRITLEESALALPRMNEFSGTGVWVIDRF